ncbi:MAG TPA: HPF/RaiA family ribosome-associated protein [Gemmatimonadaceae bacterium]|jgi:ribosome-associated translation inhibitor RaiA|nr:HPF/RaiA family ribosome-associated protein [Gemmatimonadaceae bacterium]
MEIIFHAHHADISPRLQQRADASLRKIVARLGRAVDAVVRVEEDGPTRRVELVLHAPRGRRLVARGEGRYFGPALTVALGKLGAQIGRAKRGRSGSTARRRVAKSRTRRKPAPA